MSGLGSDRTSIFEANSGAESRLQVVDVQDVPNYLRDLANSRINRANRHSRASSLVSTSTKFTTNTNADTQSIDLVLGGQYFRIARDGSRITDAAPPPYSGTFASESFRSATPSVRGSSPSLSEFSLLTDSGTSLRSAYIIASEDEEDNEAVDEGTVTPRQQSPARTPETSFRNDTRHIPLLDLGSAVASPDSSRPSTALNVANELPDRHPSYKSGVEVIDVVPWEERRSSRGDHDTSRFRLQSTPLRRRNGVRLPSLDTNMRRSAQDVEDMKWKRQSQSAGPVLYEEQDPQSPDFGILPQVPLRRKDSQALLSARHGDSRRLGRQFSSPLPLPPHDDSEGSDDNILPPSMDSENDISLHYAGMMRRLDREHRKILQIAEHEATALKQQLNEKDVVYRQELRARDFIIDDLRNQLEHVQQKLEVVEASIEGRIEKAIFRTEDVWESRWKDRDFHLRERMKRIEEDAQRTINSILDERAQEELKA